MDYSIHRVRECLSLRRNWVPHPSSECVSPLDPKAEGSTPPCGWGGGGPNSVRTTGKKARHSVYSVPPTFRCWMYYSMKFIYSIHICRRLKCCSGPSLITAIFFLPIFLTFRKKFYPLNVYCTFVVSQLLILYLIYYAYAENISYIFPLILFCFLDLLWLLWQQKKKKDSSNVCCQIFFFFLVLASFFCRAIKKLKTCWFL